MCAALVAFSATARADSNETPAPKNEGPPPPAEAPAPASRSDSETQGEIIVVTGTRTETPRAASPVTTEVIERERLLESGVQTAAEALALRPGLWIDRGFAGTPGLTMQGLGPQYSLILVDGARQIGRTDGVLDLDRFGIEDLEQIEIVRGPSSVLYGNEALAGVVNLVTRRPRDGVSMDALARVDGRLGYEARGRAAYGKKGYAAALFGSLREANPVDDETDPRGVATAFDGYRDWRVTGRANHRREAWRVDAAADYVRRDIRGVNASATGAIFDRRNVVETALMQAGATWTGERSALRVEADASVYRDQFLNDQRMSSALDAYALTDENLVETRALASHQVRRHRVSAGGELLREALTSDRLANPGDRTRGAVFVQDEWRLGATDQAIVVPGLRFDADTQFGSHWTPSLAGRWQLGDRAVVRASAAMGYRAPSFKELLLRFANTGAGYIVEGNPDLGPETSVSFQSGTEVQVTPWLRVFGDAYLNRLRGMITTVSLPDDGSGTLRFSYDNIGRARTAGVEAYAMLVRGRAGLELGWAATSTRDLDLGRALEGVPQHRVSTTLRWRDRRQGFDAFVAGVMTGHRPLYRSRDPLDATLVPRRFELRARIAKRFREGYGGFLGADNILGSGDAKLDPMLPRTLYAGIEVHR
ncbi:MAG: TonB-dependent receptor [Deltaproteobacteria bacterium]|nr:TonB-dependent receptor [Deltaproteobacteria bacterium]